MQSPEEYDLKTQNDKLQELKNNTTVEYTKQSYALNQLQTIINRHWWLYYAYYFLAIVSIIIVVLKLVTNFATITRPQLVGYVLFIVIASAYPYFIYPVENWLYIRWMLFRKVIGI
jgi:hypothetical protein